MRKAAQIFSILFHPLLLITLGVLIIFQFHSLYRTALMPQQKLIFLAIVWVGTFLLPSYIIWLVQVTDKKANLYLDKQKDRRVPLLISAILVMATFYLFSYKIGARLPYMVKNYLLGTVFAIILATLINQFYKISLHGIGLGGILALLVHLQFNSGIDLRPYIVLWILISGLVCSFRIYLKSHVPSQVYLGFLTGFCMIYLTINLNL